MSVTGTASVIRMKDVNKSFSGSVAVQNLNLEVRRGEIFGFLGPNGAGKSTTIRLLLNILNADSGAITLLGKPHTDPAVRQDIGYLSGDMALDTDLTGRQYINFVSQLHGGGHQTAITRLSEVLQANLDKKIGAYSRGNRQKIGLIASLLHKPQLLILDEPTSGFDPLIQERFAAILRQYVADGGTVFMSSHVLGEVQALCDRVAFIRQGQIGGITDVQQLLHSRAKHVTVAANSTSKAVILRSYKEIHGLHVIETTETGLHLTYDGATRPLLQYLSRLDIDDITIREPELEEIFSRYYEPAATEHTNV